MRKISPIQDLSDLPGWIQAVIFWIAFSLTAGLYVRLRRVPATPQVLGLIHRIRVAWLATASCRAIGSYTLRPVLAMRSGSGRIRRPPRFSWRRVTHQSQDSHAAFSRDGRELPDRNL